MKRVWVCQWEIPCEDGLHRKEYDSFADAVQAMRQLIAAHIDLEEYIADLVPNEGNYLRSYLSDSNFPYSEKDVPEDFELPEHGDLALYGSFIRWDYPYDAHPFLYTNLVLNPDEDETCFFDFHYNFPEEATGHGVKGMNIKIIPCMDFGNSAYPLMVWKVLRDEPQTQDQLSRRILNELGTAIDRKAIGRHLNLLKKLGYPVRHSPDGYYLEGEFSGPEPGIQYTRSAYPLLILGVLDGTSKTQTEIIREVQAKYGAKIGRNAVKRHLELLEALSFSVEHDPNGYYLKQRTC